MAWSLDGDVVATWDWRGKDKQVELVERAGEAIGAVCTDMTASPEQIHLSLRILRGKLNTLIDAIGKDVDRWGGEDYADRQN